MSKPSCAPAGTGPFGSKCDYFAQSGNLGISVCANSPLKRVLPVRRSVGIEPQPYWLRLFFCFGGDFAAGETGGVNCFTLVVSGRTPK